MSSTVHFAFWDFVSYHCSVQGPGSVCVLCSHVASWQLASWRFAIFRKTKGLMRTLVETAVRRNRLRGAQQIQVSCGAYAGFLCADVWSLGAVPTLVARTSDVQPPLMHQFWHRMMPTSVAMAVLSCEVCSRSALLLGHLMDPCRWRQQS